MQAEVYTPKLLVIYGTMILLVTMLISILIKKKRNKVIVWKREAIFGGFVVYILLVLSITLLPITVYRTVNPYKITPNINVIPLIGIDTDRFGLIGIINIVGNIFLLTPLSIFIKMLYSDKFSFKKCMIIVILFSIGIEFMQYLEMVWQLQSSRVTDINDILFNTIGGVIGYFAYDTLVKKKIHI
ncbi:VanZ family protein [Clostridium folliculivorans]|uniref:Antibiotic resistance protein VanZ n=1 Tax=Clostridium folliculivorans TaxID=2886038 RepID=A0A9W5Y642_9CLOT|nr:VanZ family protein [Clostridium folliculivorans]GKU27328.1 antibiotic resistance protein VanZ [Clostridium folliculivorans]GKU32179.1 antibiotic resistance protein VanZ [Clostridium folliculivorans]